MKFIKKFKTHDPDYLNYMNSENKILPNLSYCKDVGDVHLNPWVETRVVAKFNVTSTSSATTILWSSTKSSFSEIEIDGVVQPSVVSSYTFDTTGEHTVKYTLSDPTTIPDYVFIDCDKITSITIPNNVISIGCPLFTDIKNITNIQVNSGNTVYDSRNNCNAIIETATNTLVQGSKNTIIPNTVTSIGYMAFSGIYITNITIPDSVTTIDNGAFFGCTSLANVTIGNSVTTIGEYAFQDCNLTSITIPNSVTSIGNNCFFRCTHLVNITSLATTAPTIQTQTFRDVKNGGTLTVPKGSTGYDVWMGTGNYYLGKYSWTKVEQ